MLGQPCQGHSKGTWGGHPPCSLLWVEHHSHVAVVVPPTQKPEMHGDQELAEPAGRRLLLQITSGYAVSFHCSFHCPYTFTQYSLNPQRPWHMAVHSHTQRGWLTLSQTVTSRPKCLHRWAAGSMHGSPSLQRMVGWWWFNKDQCKLSKTGRKEVSWHLPRAPTRFTLVLFLHIHHVTLHHSLSWC